MSYQGDGIATTKKKKKKVEKKTEKKCVDYSEAIKETKMTIAQHKDRLEKLEARLNRIVAAASTAKPIKKDF
jgi:hypothetical protein